MDEQSQETEDGRRVIGGLAGFSIVAGSMLGIGIFISPPVVAGYIDSPRAFLLVWVFAGLIALGGAVAMSELGALLPKAGGDYVFQTEALGSSVAFASGWVLFGAIFTGSIATMTVALCEYQLPVLTGLEISEHFATELPFLGLVTGTRVVAVGIVLFLTGLNILGARVSAGAQTLVTVLPLALLACLAVGVVVLGAPGVTPVPISGPAQPVSIETLVVAYMSVYFAYSGWNSLIYVAGEVKKPGRNIPLALISGTVVVTLLYVVMCTAFLSILGMGGLREAGEAGTAAAGLVAGQTGQIVVTTLIAMALLAGLNATVLGGARVAYAMARAGAFWRGVGHLHQRSGVPQRALLLQAVWTCAFILSGSFEDIYSMASLAMIVTGSLTVLSLFVLRRTRPDAPRSYKATLYPWLPLLYLVSSVLVISVMVSRAFSGKPDAWYPLFGLAVLIATFLGHRLWVQWRGGRG